jgi:hypothetical protein
MNSCVGRYIIPIIFDAHNGMDSNNFNLSKFALRTLHCQWCAGLSCDRLQALCVLFSEVLCVKGLCLSCSKHGLNHPDNFHACGELTLISQKPNFNSLIKKCYELYFGCKMGDKYK